MNLFNEATKAFEALIEGNDPSIEVLLEYAQAHLSEAEDKKARRLLGRSKAHVQEAVNLLAR